MKLIPRIARFVLTLDVILAGKAFAQKSFLSDTLVRKDQVQHVLEHQPVKVPSCKNAVVSTLFFPYASQWFHCFA